MAETISKTATISERLRFVLFDDRIERHSLGTASLEISRLSFGDIGYAAVSKAVNKLAIVISSCFALLFVIVTFNMDDEVGYWVFGILFAISALIAAWNSVFPPYRVVLYASHHSLQWNVSAFARKRNRQVQKVLDAVTNYQNRINARNVFEPSVETLESESGGEEEDSFTEDPAEAAEEGLEGIAADAENE